jgi:ASC-1-like (ASCH) protein
MILSFPNPEHVYPILDGELNQKTRISSKKKSEEGEVIQLYYRNTCGKSCYSCLNSKIVTGRKCPHFDPKTYPSDSKGNQVSRCPDFVNFLGYAIVTNIKRYSSFEEILQEQNRVNKWIDAEGFKSIEEAKEHYKELWGKESETYPLTVILWKMKGKSLSKLSHGEAQD